MHAKPKTWRTLFPVHPAADVFPMMTDDELDKLAEDIKQNGLQQQIVLWQDNSDTHLTSSMPYYVIDGRNRLAAMDRAGIPVPAYPLGASIDLRFALVCGWKWAATGPIKGKWEKVPGVDPAAFAIGANVRRRHLSKEQHADLIVKAVQAGEEFLAKMASEKTEVAVKPGRPKDPVKEKAVAEGEKQGIGKRTIERSLAKQEDRPKAPRKPKLELAPRVEPLRAAAPPLPIETYEQKLEAKVAKAAEEVRQVELALNYWRRELSEAKAVLKTYQDKQTEEEVA